MQMKLTGFSNKKRRKIDKLDLVKFLTLIK